MISSLIYNEQSSFFVFINSKICFPKRLHKPLGFIYSKEVRYSVLQFMEECQSDVVWLFFVSEVPVLSSLEDGTKEIKETNKGTFSLKE